MALKPTPPRQIERQRAHEEMIAQADAEAKAAEKAEKAAAKKGAK